jgi:hypothetical protein
MVIVLFVVCAMFGLAAVVLWAAYSSARAKLGQIKHIGRAILELLRDTQSTPQLRSLREQLEALLDE